MENPRYTGSALPCVRGRVNYYLLLFPSYSLVHLLRDLVVVFALRIIAGCCDIARIQLACKASAAAEMLSVEYQGMN